MYIYITLAQQLGIAMQSLWNLMWLFFLRKRHWRYVHLLKIMETDLGDIKKDEVQIIGNLKDVVLAERKLRQISKNQGNPASYGNVGVMTENNWVVFINDPVYFPIKCGGDPKLGTHVRIVYRGQVKREPSLFAMLRLEDGRFLFNLAYRSPIRAWTVEGPGSIAREGESHSEALSRCVRSEIGRTVKKAQLLTPPGLGVLPERGLVGEFVPVYMITVGSPDTEERITDPTIAGHVALSFKEVSEAFQRGFVEIGKKKYYCCDGFTGYALFMAYLNGLIGSE